MTTHVPQTRTVRALAEELEVLLKLLADIPAADWTLPTPCPGWDVRANVAHILGTESMLEGIEAPDVAVERDELPHVRNDIGAFNEAWVVGHAETDPADLLDLLRSVTAARLHRLQEMSAEEWDADSFTPAGPDTFGRFMRIRVFDCWMHEQDIRDAVGRPGHTSGLAVDVALDEMVQALGYVVGKRAGAPDGSSVTFSLTDVGRDVHVLVDGRAALVESLPGPATATLRMGVHPFSRLAGGRTTPDAVIDPVELEGDVDLAQRVLDNLAYTI